MINFQSYMERNIVRKSRTCQEFATCETTSINKHAEIIPMDDSDKAVGKRIIAMREALGLQQQEFAKAIKVAKNTLNGYESGARPLTMESARRIRRRFGVTVDWLMFGDLGLASRDLMLRLGPNPEPEAPPAKRHKNHSTK